MNRSVYASIRSEAAQSVVEKVRSGEVEDLWSISMILLIMGEVF